MQSLVRSVILLMLVLLTTVVAMKSAHAGIIDHIEVRQAGDEAEIRIMLVTQIQYLRQASLKNGDIRIYFNLLGIDALDSRLVPETRKSAPSDIAPQFTITYPELDSSLSISFGKPVDYHIRIGTRSISIFTPALKPKDVQESKPAAPVVAVVPLVVPDANLPSVSGSTTPLQAPPPVKAIELEAQQLIGSANYALQNDRPDIAIERLNKLLNLPPNKQSQTAQELIGEAREKNGEYDKARVEYQLYLDLYPAAKDAAQVKQRMAKLPAVNNVRPAPAAVTAKPNLVEESMVVSGGLSQYYYHGVSHTDSLSISGPTSTSSSLTIQDQSQLFSMLDVTGRKRSETADTRLVFRDSYNANFLSGQTSSNRFEAAYIEQNARNHTYMYRVGRQTGLGAGAPGRFDGVMGGYSFNPTWRINGVAGKPVEYINGGLSTASNKNFEGLSVDLSPNPDRWSSSGYFIQQRISGIVDRRAVGIEGHYFDAQRNFMGLFEYDTLFRKVDLGLIQGNWTTEKNTNFNVLLDHRRSPQLQLSNALIGLPIQSVAELLQSGVSMDTIISDASVLSPISNIFAIGMTQPYNQHIRVGGDFRVSNTTGSGTTSTGQPGAVASGNTYAYSVQATGNGMFRENDFGIVNATYTSAQAYHGQSLTFTQVEPFRQNWRLDMLLLLYSQTDSAGTHQTQIRPSLKLSYRWSDSINLEGEGGIEQTHITSATQDDNTRRKYFYLGYRWDFR
jgi:tetratricopeptide (TPR) repeat protein